MRFPVSVKGVVLRDGRVLLLRNDRDEWELPGGRLEVDETPEQCVVREIAEETGWAVAAGPILDSWLYHVAAVDRDVFVVTYGCTLAPGQDAAPVPSAEHREVGLFTAEEVPALPMPAGYRRSIAHWYARGRPDAAPPPDERIGSGPPATGGPSRSTPHGAASRPTR